jgi:hypothetical protein
MAEYSPTRALMQRFGAAPTRENYLKFSFLGKPPAGDNPELEETMPEQFRLPVREYDKLDATAIPEADLENLGNAKAVYDAVRGMSKR